MKSKNIEIVFIDDIAIDEDFGKSSDEETSDQDSDHGLFGEYL